MRGARAAAPVPARAAAHAAPQPAAPAALDLAEREAERAGEAAARGTPPTRWSFAAVPVSPLPPEAAGLDARAAEAVAGGGRPVDAPTRRAMEPRLRLDLSRVRLHDDARATAATRAAGAEALALGDDVALAAPHDPASARSRALVGHELAHVAQQRAAGTVALQRKDGASAPAATTLAGLPEADRKRIQAVTAEVVVPGLAEKLATTGTKVTSAFPGGVTAELDASVDKSLHHGLTNVAGSLSAGVELTPAPLAPNTTVTLELDLGGTFGKGLYRFTYVAPPPAGAKKTPQPQRILVESLGKATAPAGTKPPAAAAPGATPAVDPVAEKIKRHSLSHSYKGAELDALRAALGQLPDSHLTLLSGLKFRRDTVHATEPDAAGDYDQKTHTITIYDNAFSASQTRYTQGTVASSKATRAIVHELGHAFDLVALRKAGAEKDKADKAVAGLPKRFPDPDDPTRYRWENREQKQEIDAVLQAQKDAEKGLLTARSVSGTKTIKKKDGTFEEEIGTAAKGNKFREAAAKDGPKAVTAYGDQDWQEAYAEAYSLYLTSPETLKALRPNVYDHLDKTLPK